MPIREKAEDLEHEREVMKQHQILPPNNIQ